MNLVDRVKNILLKPKEEWPVIEKETDTIADIYKNYALILAAIPAVCGFIGSSLIGGSFMGVSMRMPIGAGIGTMVVGYVLGLVMLYVVAWVIDALAPTFQAEKNMLQSFKLAAYAYTASWVGGVFSIIPGLGVIGILFALYGLYIFYVGVPTMKKCPPDKAIGYTALVIVCVIVLSIIVGVVVGGLTMAMGGARMGMH